MATKRLKELLEARKSSPRDNSGSTFWNYYLFFFKQNVLFSNYLLYFSVNSNGHLQPGQVIIIY